MPTRLRFAPLLFLPALLLLPPGSALAQGYPYVSQPAAVCAAISHPLRQGLSDRTAGGDVTRLQTFLQSRGYFPYYPTGYFGSFTRAAVTAFQRVERIPATGYVGPLTIAAIDSLGCTGATPAASPYYFPLPSASYPPTAAVPYIQYATPNSGPEGSTVTVIGSGFTASNTLNFNGYTMPGIYSNGTSLTFTVPSMVGMNSGGVYSFNVVSQSGSSNYYAFTLTSGSLNGTQPAITGINGPVSITAGQSATWTVNATFPGYYFGNAQYSVQWGDEQSYPYAYGTTAYPLTQGSATFTHAYQTPGTYTPTFTVSLNGQQVSAEASVTVTP